MANSHEHHVLPVSVYAKTLMALAVLMALTVVMARVHVGPQGTAVYNNLIALAIAFVKGTLVVLFFMNGKYSTQLTKLWIVIGFVWVTLLALIYGDYATRHEEGMTNWAPQGATAFPRDFNDPNQPVNANDTAVERRMGVRGN